MKNKKSIAIALLVLLLTVLIIAGSTYAYYIATINNDNAVDADIQARTLGLHFEDGPEINLPDALPGQTVIKKFEVTNTGTEKTGYSLYLKNFNSNFENKADVVYSLSYIENDVDCTENCSTTVHTIVNNDYFANEWQLYEALALNQTIDSNKKQEYTLTIEYLNKPENQNVDMGKHMIGTIQIVRAGMGETLEGGIIWYDNNSNSQIDLNDVLDVAGEKLYVLSNNGTEVTTIAMYQLQVGGYVSYDPYEVVSYTNPTGLQDKHIGNNSDEGKISCIFAEVDGSDVCYNRVLTAAEAYGSWLYNASGVQLEVSHTRYDYSIINYAGFNNATYLPDLGGFLGSGMEGSADAGDALFPEGVRPIIIYELSELGI